MTVMLAFSSQAAYYLVGQAPFGTGWSPSSGVEMTQNADGSYSYTATINGTIWFVMTDQFADAGDWNTFNKNYRIGPTGGDQTVNAGVWTQTQRAGGDNGAYKFTGSGEEYTIKLIPAAMQFIIEGYVAPPDPSQEFYTVCGTPAAVFGTEWDPSNTENDMVKQDDGTYKLTKTNCELTAGIEFKYKVAYNHDWAQSWPSFDIVVPVEESGTYNVTFTFDPTAEEPMPECTLTKTGDGPEVDVHTGELYILGEVNGYGWDPSNAFKMDTEDENVFTAQIITEGKNIDENDGIGYSYFSFTTKLSESSGDWGSIAPYRIGSMDDGYPLTEDLFGTEITLAGYNTQNSFKVAAGTYDVTVNLDAMTMVINVPVPERTETPVLTYDEETLTVTATGEGVVTLLVNGEEVENPYTFEQTDEAVSYEVSAYAQAEGKEVSDVVVLTIIVPAKPVEPENPYQLEKIWEFNDMAALNMTGDAVGHVRQAFGMNGKFYVNDKSTQTIRVVDKNGYTEATYPGGANCGISRDEAGNIIVSNTAFPGAWAADATIKVINPETSEMMEYTVPAECGLAGRCDFIGFAKGNLMEDGVLYLVGGTTSGVAVLTIAGGQVSTDECYPATCDGLTPSTSTVVNFYKDLNDEEALLYVTRNAPLAKLAADGDNFVVAQAFTLPNKGACNGAFPLIWDEKEFYIYPTLPNYQDGFAIAELGADEPIVDVPSTVTANANSFSSNWLNAEVDDEGVTIYQYYPGSHFTVYRLTKDQGGVDEMTADTNKIVAGVRYYNIMGQEMKEANGLTIVVTTYTDGTRSAMKVIK